jgi:hypothetical protein
LTNEKTKRKVTKGHEFAHIPHISRNEGEGILNGLVKCSFSSPWKQWRWWFPTRSRRWSLMQWINPKTKGWGRPNLVCNVEEKTFEPNGKMEWSSEKKLCTHPWAWIGFQTCTMWIKNHVKDDDGEGMVMQYIHSVFLKSIYSPFYKLPI